MSLTGCSIFKAARYELNELKNLMNFKKNIQKIIKIKRQTDINNPVYKYISGEIPNFNIAVKPK